MEPADEPLQITDDGIGAIDDREEFFLNIDDDQKGLGALQAAHA